MTSEYEATFVLTHRSKKLVQTSSHDPNFDFYRKSSTFVVLIYVFLSALGAMSATTLILLGIGDTWGPFDLIMSEGGYTSPLVFLYLLVGTIVSLGITLPFPKSKFDRNAIRFAYFCILGAGFGPGMVWTQYGYVSIGGSIAVYLSLSILDVCIDSRRKRRSGRVSGHQQNITLAPLPNPATSSTTTQGTLPANERDQIAQDTGVESVAFETSQDFRFVQRHDTEIDIGTSSPRRRFGFRF